MSESWPVPPRSGRTRYVWLIRKTREPCWRWWSSANPKMKISITKQWRYASPPAPAAHTHLATRVPRGMPPQKAYSPRDRLILNVSIARSLTRKLCLRHSPMSFRLPHVRQLNDLPSNAVSYTKAKYPANNVSQEEPSDEDNEDDEDLSAALANLRQQQEARAKNRAARRGQFAEEHDSSAGACSLEAATDAGTILTQVAR